MLNIENLTKTYGAQVLFRDATFLVGEQARIGVVGPNGAGKSTFFRILVGDEHPDSGEVRAPKNYRIAMMKQEWAPHTGDSILTSALREHRAWFEAREKLRRLEGNFGDEPDPGKLSEYHRVENEYTALGGYGLEQTAKELLSGLGFKPEQFDSPCKDLSGGWRIRVHMAGLLLQQSDLLLLDEPTNHLDVESVVWFEEFLRTYPNSVMLITHDRRLVERFATETLEFAPPTLTLWPGSLKKFESQKSVRMEQLEAEITNKEKEVERLQEFVAKFRAKATKARQAQSRLRTSESYEEEIRQLRSMMPVISKRPSRFHLQLRKRLPRTVIEMEQSSIGYKKHHPLFSIDHCLIEAGKKIGVIGVNGVGKSTFLKICAGELAPLSGKIRRNEEVTIGYFAQHRMEELSYGMKTFDYLYDQSQGNTISEVRAVAASLGLSSNDMDKPLDVLSGGEKARVSLTRILLSRPGLLLLDEPTNHLDIEACDALVRGLSTYEGTVLVVSHNRDFLDSLSNLILEIQPGQAVFHHGNYSEWLSRMKGGPAAQGDSSAPARKISSGKKTKEQRRLEAEERQRRYNQLKQGRGELFETEQKIKLLTQEGNDLDAYLCLPESPKDPEFHKKLRRRGEVTQELQTLEAKWLELSDGSEKEAK